MNKKTRKGLPDLVTRSNLSSEAENPHRKFLRVANLELRKSLCSRVRQAAIRRVAEMDEQLADIEGQQAQLLWAVRKSGPAASSPADGPHFPPDAEGIGQETFTLKY
jgi:hypothetical protein